MNLDVSLGVKGASFPFDHVAHTSCEKIEFGLPDFWIGISDIAPIR